jgi:hypothetical protein
MKSSRHCFPPHSADRKRSEQKNHFVMKVMSDVSTLSSEKNGLFSIIFD